MQFTGYWFGSVRVDDVTHDHDLIIDHGKIRKRQKAASGKFRGAYGHTPLSAEEDIPWRCCRLVIGTGADGGRRSCSRSGATRSRPGTCRPAPHAQHQAGRAARAGRPPSPSK
jgi:hypothetical protein